MILDLRCQIVEQLKELPTRNPSPYDEGRMDAFNKVLDLISEIERKRWMERGFKGNS